MGGKLKTMIELKISCSNIMLNYWLSKKFKLLGNCEFNHLTIILTILSLFNKQAKPNQKKES